MSSEGQPTIRLGNDRRQWEYRVVMLNTEGFLGPNVDITGLGEYLNEAGDEGWELVTASPITRDQGETSGLIGILKRPR